jgi:hypothetical protein
MAIMSQRRAAFGWVLAVAMIGSVGLFAQKKDDKKQDEAQKKEALAIFKLVDDVMAGTAQPTNDLGLTWVHEDFLKAQGNKEFVPFIVTLDPSKVTAGTLSYYWRVVSKNPAPSPTPDPAAKKDDKKKDDKKGNARTEYPWEDLHVIPVAAGQTTPMRIARSFTVPAGAYDVYIVAREPMAQAKNAPAPKTSILKQSVTVPDYWNGELTTSSVIMAQRLEPLAAPLTPQQLSERPYAMGSMEIVPQIETAFTKKGELQPVFMVYNPKLDSNNKPDITIEYNFYSKPSGAPEKFFNHTSPQNFNAQTMPQFDAAAGHQIPGGIAIPLGSFPEGDYRLEIKITDKIANKTVTRDVNFTVTS